METWITHDDLLKQLPRVFDYDMDSWYLIVNYDFTNEWWECYYENDLCKRIIAHYNTDLCKALRDTLLDYEEQFKN